MHHGSQLASIPISLACRPPTPPNGSAILMTVHVLRDLVGEFKRIAKARREVKASRNKVEEDAPTAEDLADALDLNHELQLLLEPITSAIHALCFGVYSLFTLPGAACGARFFCYAGLRIIARQGKRSRMPLAHAQRGRALLHPRAALIAGEAVSATAIKEKVDGFESADKGGVAPRRAPKPCWRPASREQAVSWAAALAVAICIAVFFALFKFPAAASTSGIQVLPLQRFGSNLRGAAGSGRFVSVSYDGGNAAGRRLAAASGVSSFRITNTLVTPSNLAAAASEAVMLTDAATGAAAAFEGDPISVMRRGSTLVMMTRSYSDSSKGTDTAPRVDMVAGDHQR